MSKLKFIGEIVHGEKYEHNGETKWKNTKAGALFVDDEGKHRVKIFDSWFSVFPKKANEGDYKAAKETVKNTQGPDESEEIPY